MALASPTFVRPARTWEEAAAVVPTAPNSYAVDLDPVWVVVNGTRLSVPFALPVALYAMRHHQTAS